MKDQLQLFNIQLKEIVVFLLLISFGLGFYLTQIEFPQSAPKKFASNPEGEKKKRWSGHSFAAETEVQKYASTSDLAPGWSTERAWSGEDDWEPFTAVDPSSNYVYQLTTRFTAAFSAIIFRSSSDNGETWGSDKIITPVHQWQADPQIQVANDGTIFVAWLDGPDWKTKLTKSFDRGITWTAPVDVAPNMTWTDHAWLVISPDGKDVYIGFNKNDMYFVSSHNSGQTFNTPIRLSSYRSRTLMQVGGAISPNGDVYFAVADYPPDYNAVTYIRIVTSNDGGVSWSTLIVDSSQASPACDSIPGCYYGFFSAIADIAVDQNGMIMLAYNAGLIPYQPEQIYFKTSFDGINWSERKQISHHNLYAWNSFPSLRAGISPGDFRIVWQGNKNGNMNGWNTFYRRTTDGGLTWSHALRLSNRKSGAPYKNSDGYQFTYGDYLSLAVDSDGKNHVIWGEGTSYDGPGGVWYSSGIESIELAFVSTDTELIDYDVDSINLSKEVIGKLSLKDDSISLEQNYPNPFNPSTKIRFTITPENLPEQKDQVNVTLRIYDLLGKEVATIINENKPAGTYEIEFNSAATLASGIYYYRLTAGKFIQTRKMLLIK